MHSDHDFNILLKTKPTHTRESPKAVHLVRVLKDHASCNGSYLFKSLQPAFLAKKLTHKHIKIKTFLCLVFTPVNLSTLIAQGQVGQLQFRNLEGQISHCNGYNGMFC